MSPNVSSSATSLISPYAGEESRQIKSLSDSDIDDLLNGRGWGLAKAAELNGVPGPKHLLEMSAKIELSPEQITAINGVWSEMNAKAKALGARYVALEKTLNDEFAAGAMSAERLEALLNEISKVHAELRYTHLSAHLEMSPILTVHQVKQYNSLRGYANGDPCAQVPEGHNPTMWKMHNGCD
ncbi:MAG: hypothetical protein ACPHEQ_04555 [Arenicellales bacterium]